MLGVACEAVTGRHWLMLQVVEHESFALVEVEWHLKELKRVVLARHFRHNIKCLVKLLDVKRLEAHKSFDRLTFFIELLTYQILRYIIRVQSNRLVGSEPIGSNSSFLDCAFVKLKGFGQAV